jgi:LacI family transcriptional regulator
MRRFGEELFMRNISSGSRKYLEVKARIKQMIIKEKLEGKLPGERALADEFGFSYMTIRHAVNELVTEGFLYRMPRKGTFVASQKTRYNHNSNIGFYLNEKYPDGISNPYYSLVFKNIQKVLREHNYNLVYYTQLEDIDPRNVEGVLAVSSPDSSAKLSELVKFVSVVLVEEDVEGSDVPAVLIDNFNSTYHAIEFARSLGHTFIGYLSGDCSTSTGCRRLAGYQTALRDFGIALDENYIYKGNNEFESGYGSAAHFLSLHPVPTFIHCANDMMALGLMKGLVEKGVGIPDKISICGFDNIEECERIHPSLTTMAVDFKQLAEESVELLLSQIRNESGPKKRIIPARLISRESTGKF